MKFSEEKLAMLFAKDAVDSILKHAENLGGIGSRAKLKIILQELRNAQLLMEAKYVRH